MEFRLQAECYECERFRLKAELHATLLIDPLPTLFMCGICGVVDFDGQPVDRRLLKRMADVIEHRGPDGEGFYFNDSPARYQTSSSGPSREARVGLAARRLAIIDVAAGHQPIGNEDGSVWAAYNGEIYNFNDLRIELESLGHRFRTHGDTEFIG